MAEWFKAAVLKTVERKLRGFESYSLRQRRDIRGEMAESAEGARLLSECGVKAPPRVRIPLSPPFQILKATGLRSPFLVLEKAYCIAYYFIVKTLVLSAEC